MPGMRQAGRGVGVSVRVLSAGTGMLGGGGQAPAAGGPCDGVLVVPALTGAVLAGSPVCPALGALARLSRLRGGAPAWVPVLQVPGQAAGAGRPLGLPPPPASLSRPPSAFEAVCFRWAVLLRRRGWVPARAAAQTVGHSAALRGAAGCPKLAGCRSGAHAPPARVVLARGVAAGGPCPSGQRPAGQKVPFTPSVRLRRTAPPSRGSNDGRARSSRPTKEAVPCRCGLRITRGA